MELFIALGFSSSHQEDPEKAVPHPRARIYKPLRLLIDPHPFFLLNLYLHLYTLIIMGWFDHGSDEHGAYDQVRLPS